MQEFYFIQKVIDRLSGFKRPIAIEGLNFMRISFIFI